MKRSLGRWKCPVFMTWVSGNTGILFLTIHQSVNLSYIFFCMFFHNKIVKKLNSMMQGSWSVSFISLSPALIN